MVKQNYRLGCPLCGSLKYPKNFSKDNAINRLLIQSFIGRRKIKYSECLNVGILNTFQKFLISRLENVYFRLTGINIRQLIINSNRSLTTKIIPSPISTAVHSPIDTTIRPPVDIAVFYPKLTAKIKPNKVVVI